MRALITILMLCAGAASAEPDCAGSPTPEQSELVAFDPSSDFDAHPGVPTADETAKLEAGISLRPQLRPCKFKMFELGRERMRERGAVCKDWTILGETLKPIKGRYRGCGIPSPVRIHMVSGVGLNQFALMDCETAITLKTWIEVVAKPAFADVGGGLIGMRLVGHYSCRTQNNKIRARLSEHARGRAIDISAFILADGSVLSVRDGWETENSNDVLRQLHGGACGLFGTVLGPEADQYHKDHFHFDTARRTSGPVCR